MDETRERAQHVIDYLDAVTRNGYRYNHLMSVEYIDKAELDWSVHSRTALSGFQYPDTSGEWFFPPIKPDGDMDVVIPCRYSFASTQPLSEKQNTYNYVGEPYRWVGHNRKFLECCNGFSGFKQYREIESEKDNAAVALLLLKWVDQRHVEDLPLLMCYALRGINRMGFFLDEELLGVNIWDNNNRFINYRYLFDNGHKDLPLMLRHCFYTDNHIVLQCRNLGLRVNEGPRYGVGITDTFTVRTQ